MYKVFFLRQIPIYGVIRKQKQVTVIHLIMFIWRTHHFRAILADKTFGAIANVVLVFTTIFDTNATVQTNVGA
jgi:hypothetical protein